MMSHGDFVNKPHSSERKLCSILLLKALSQAFFGLCGISLLSVVSLESSHTQ